MSPSSSSAVNLARGSDNPPQALQVSPADMFRHKGQMTVITYQGAGVVQVVIPPTDRGFCFELRTNERISPIQTIESSRVATTADQTGDHSHSAETKEDSPCQTGDHSHSAEPMDDCPQLSVELPEVKPPLSEDCAGSAQNSIPSAKDNSQIRWQEWNTPNIC
jgi:hypothetical protein